MLSRDTNHSKMSGTALFYLNLAMPAVPVALLCFAAILLCLYLRHRRFRERCAIARMQHEPPPSASLPTRIIPNHPNNSPSNFGGRDDGECSSGDVGDGSGPSDESGSSRRTEDPETGDAGVAETNVTECAICLCDLAPLEVAIALPCAHEYHAECFRAWEAAVIAHSISGDLPRPGRAWQLPSLLVTCPLCSCMLAAADLKTPSAARRKLRRTGLFCQGFSAERGRRARAPCRSELSRT